MKAIRFHKAVERELKNWPIGVKEGLAELLALLSEGQPLSMPTSRPMSIISKGVHELRIHDRSGQYRAFYYLKVKDAILVFHAFKKKTQIAPKKEIELAKTRLGELI